MTEYYKIGILRNNPTSVEWENLYLKKEGDNYEIIMHTPQHRVPVQTKIEKISKEEVDDVIKKFNEN